MTVIVHNIWSKGIHEVILIPGRQQVRQVVTVFITVVVLTSDPGSLRCKVCPGQEVFDTSGVLRELEVKVVRKWRNP